EEPMSLSPQFETNLSLLQLEPSQDGAILLDMEHDRLLKLNPVGVEIWKLFCSGDSESQIVEKLAEKYKLDPQRVAQDVRALLRRISELGIAPGPTSLANPSPSQI